MKSPSPLLLRGKIPLYPHFAKGEEGGLER